MAYAIVVTKELTVGTDFMYRRSLSLVLHGEIKLCHSSTLSSLIN